MLWTNPLQYPYESGRLFLGHAQGQNIGIKTERHALTIAGAGAGKGAAVIIPNLLKWPHNALVIDPKGEAAEATTEAREAMGQAVHVLDPFLTSKVDDRFRASYNPLATLDIKSLTIKEDIEAISDGIVKRDNPESSHWDDGAQAIISGLIAFLLLEAPDDKKNLLELRAIIRNVDEFAQTIEQMKNLQGCAGLCESGASAAFAKEGGYFVSNAEKNTRWLDSEAMKNVLSESTFSLADLKNGNASIYLVLPANYLGQHGRFLRLFVRCGIEAMARKTASGELRQEQCLFLLDEFFSLGYIDEISKAAGLMRGYGLQLWPILQDLGQLITLYGREGSETFFANADMHQFFGNTDQLTLEQISLRLGVTDMNEVPLPPAAPTPMTGNIGGGLSALTGKSKQTSTRALGSILGGAVTMAGNAANAAAQARYQDEMNLYQREMSKHGRPRVTTDEVAELVQKKNDVVADNMICFVYGREPLLLQPAPYFRRAEKLIEGVFASGEINDLVGAGIKFGQLFIFMIFYLSISNVFFIQSDTILLITLGLAILSVVLFRQFDVWAKIVALVRK